MIIRKHKDTLIMIEQNHHAQISKEIISHWKDVFFKDDPYINSVLYAVKMHDYGWDLFDKQPFWNDQTKSPYSFIDFPVLPKITLYTEGVNKIELNDPYAAALCSAHYINFMKRHPTPEVDIYLEKENKRTRCILASYPSITKDTFNNHLEILKFADNISLYVCLNEPGVSKSAEHYFFKEGIPISPQINPENLSKIEASWVNRETISLKGLPEVPAFSILVKQKKLLKQKIEDTGLIKAYQATPYENIKITFNIS